MSQQTKFIIAAIAFLIPVGVYILQWVFYNVGKLFWNFLFPKLRRNSKLRYKFIEFNSRMGGNELAFTLTGIIILYFMAVLVYLFT